MKNGSTNIPACADSLLVENGVVKKLIVEAPGTFEVSGAETMLAQL